MQVDRIGTFRGVLADWAVNSTKNGFPQFIANLSAAEYFNEESGEWEDWAEYGMEIIGYFCLFGANQKPTLNVDQLMDALGWDGQSFAALNDTDWSKTVVQFRVEENDYNGKVSLQVSWIDDKDVTPGQTVKKLTSAELTNMDVKYGNLLKTVAKPPTPARPSTPPAVPGKPATTATAAAEADAKPPKSGRGRKPGSKNKPKVNTPDLPTAKPGAGLPSGVCTQGEAWDEVNALRAKDKTEKDVSEEWLKAVNKIVPGKEDDEITTKEWFRIKEAVNQVTAVF